MSASGRCVVGLAILAAWLVVIATYDVWEVRRQRRRATTGAATRQPTDPGYVERLVTARLLSGQLDPGLYRDCVAAIASTVDRVDHSWTIGTTDDDAVDRLSAALPDVSPDTVRAALELAQLRAGVEDLVRLLHLTTPQALRIIALSRQR